MRKERLQTEDIMAFVVGMHYPLALERYMAARYNVIIHRVPEVNTLLQRTFGVLLYIEDLIAICQLGGINKRDARLFCSYEYLSLNERERLKKNFIEGFMKLGYSRGSVDSLFRIIAYTSCECLKREYVAACVKNYIKQTAQMMFLPL
jgi:hypothetical protein